MVRVVAEGLAFPEGPNWMPDGSVLLVELARGTLSRVDPDGRLEVVSELGGGPNGVTLDAAGRALVCNNGGGEFASQGGPNQQQARIEAVDLESGLSEWLYDACDGRPLSAPNDLVLDGGRGFWFTDFGKRSARAQAIGSVYWARVDGSEIREVIRGLHSPNGIGVSPDGNELYVTETLTARLWSWRIDAEGSVARVRGTQHGGTFVAGSSTYCRFDSLVISASGRVLIGTLETGGITEVDPMSGWTEFHPLPDRLVTNACFGGESRHTLYVTLAESGRLVEMRWHEAGRA